MIRVNRFNLIWMLVLLLFFVGVGCGAGNEAPAPTQQEAAEEPLESDYILGKWEVNDGRFGHKIFDFQENGRLLIEDVETGELIEMSYVFVEQNTILLSGYDEFNGSAVLKFYEDKLDLMINFEGTIFGELYVFTREEALE